MKELQELKIWLEARRTNAMLQCAQFKNVDKQTWAIAKGKYEAFGLAIDKVELLLQAQQPNSEPSATIAATVGALAKKPYLKIKS